MMRKVISAILVVAMIVIPFTAIAADFDNHWVKADADYLIKAGILTPDASGNIKPDELMIRGEFVTLVNKVFNFTEKDATGFKDAPAGSKYYDAFAIAKKAGYVKGNEQGEAKPNDNIVRGEVAVILARVLKFGDGTKSYPEKDVQGWAKGGVAALEAKGIMKGNDKGEFQGYNNLTNAEGYVLAARIHRLKATAVTATPKPAEPTAPPVNEELPTLSNAKGYMIYDTFTNAKKIDETGWKPLAVEEGNYSSGNGVYSDTTTPGIGNFLMGVRTSGGGTGGGMYRLFPRMFQVLSSIPSELEKPEDLPDDSVVVVEYDVRLGCDSDSKRAMCQLRGPFGTEGGQPLISLMYQRNHAEAHLVFGTSDKMKNTDATTDVLKEGQWYRVRQEIHVKSGASYGNNFDFYVNGVKTAENQKYASTTGSKCGVLGLAMFSTSAWQTNISSKSKTGVAVDNFSVYIGSKTDLSVNKGALIAGLRTGGAKLATAKANIGEAPGQYAASLVTALTAASDSATTVYYSLKADQAAVDKALADYNAALTALVANK